MLLFEGVAYVLLALLSLFAATRLRNDLQPRTKSSLVLALGGIVFLALMLGMGAMIHAAIGDGLIHFRSRQFGLIHADRHEDPVGFWGTLLVMYAFAVALGGMGFTLWLKGLERLGLDRA